MKPLQKITFPPVSYEIGGKIPRYPVPRYPWQT